MGFFLLIDDSTGPIYIRLTSLLFPHLVQSGIAKTKPVRKSLVYPDLSS